ncbi:alpha/beta-hydrolase [Aspergillus costaricaensis CBS 115574]|uniref:Alpha/beta-hydrolase n=1 Tax=Aspergillus costaricaensis CBS 115574 TaxID=1448317 RepID=A0ACD1IEK8_9EURO|nr:alpha/beta-hydrolase [Aspergillus costaricaensis CBS 115574]RAK89049.1 alpha/beta-hydrolase [Aspergillus costaricaensis CBS 115574]
MNKPPPPNQAPIINLPTTTNQTYIQTIIGKPSPLSPNIDNFLGIPYGEITHRWKHAELRTHLPSDVFYATTNGPKCPQPPGGDNSAYFQADIPFPKPIPESEFDCLNLNIIRPSATGLSHAGIDPFIKLPVLVWIHGGAGAFGAGSDPIIDPTRLILRSIESRRPMIAITISYRLGVFGLLGSADILDTQAPTTDIKGLNFATYDQKIALTWISTNIGYFGGDADQITLGGNSSGSHDVHAHLLDADTHGTPLFRRVIMHSGARGTVSPGSLADAEVGWRKLCGYWGVNEEMGGLQRVERMRRIPARELLEGALVNGVCVMPPVVDGVGMGWEVVRLPEVEGGAKFRDGGCGRRYPVEVMIGACEAESAGHFQESNITFSSLEETFTKSYPTPEAATPILQLYGLVEGASQRSLLSGLERFRSDAVFHLPIHRTIDALRTQRHNVYGDADSIQNFHIEFGNPFPGPKMGCAHHGVELIYLFDAFHEQLVGLDDLSTGQGVVKHRELVSRVQDHWIGFIVGRAVQKVSDKEVLVWGEDGYTRVEMFDEMSRWVERKRQLEVLGRDVKSMMRVFWALG